MKQIQNLSNQDLSNQDLSNQDLSFYIFKKSNLSGSNLSNCNLIAANFALSDLRNCDFRGSDLTDCVFSGSKMKGIKLPKDVIFTPNEIRTIILKAAKHIVENPFNLKMDRWHSCNTTHCFAGFMCVLDKRMSKLEEKYSTGTLMYLIFSQLTERENLFYRRLMYMPDDMALTVLKDIV